MPLSNSDKVNKKTIYIGWKCFFSWFYFLPEVGLWFRLWQYHYSNKQTVKSTCITLYNEIVHCTIRTRAQSVRRQHEKRTPEKSEMVTYKDTTQVARNRWVSVILIKPLDRLGYTMLKWLKIFYTPNLMLKLFKIFCIWRQGEGLSSEIAQLNIKY